MGIKKPQHVLWEILLRLDLMLFLLSYIETEGGEDSRNCGESDVDDDAPLVLVFSCHCCDSS